MTESQTDLPGNCTTSNTTGNKTILFLGAQAAGLEVNSPVAPFGFAWLQRLSLPYFNEEGLPSGLAEIRWSILKESLPGCPLIREQIAREIFHIKTVQGG
jgi:hypothetical protein